MVRRKKGVKNKVYKICKLCQVYSEIPLNKRRLSGDRVIQFRTCPKIKKEISEDTEGCMYFTLCVRFWCPKNEEWIMPKVCLHKKSNKQAGCVRCKYGNIIKKIVEGK